MNITEVFQLQYLSVTLILILGSLGMGMFWNRRTADKKIKKNCESFPRQPKKKKMEILSPPEISTKNEEEVEEAEKEGNIFQLQLNKRWRELCQLQLVKQWKDRHNTF